jgi:hypothetical protein
LVAWADAEGILGHMENKTFEPFKIVGLVERDGNLFAVTQAEVVGNSIRRLIRDWVKTNDGETFALYKAMKKNSDTFAERSKAYEVLVVAYLDSFDANDGTDIDESAPSADLARWFQRFTYSIPAL